MKVRYRARALADLEDIFRYLSPRSLAGAEKVLRAIYAAIKEISEHPRSTLRTSDPDIRTKILGDIVTRSSTELSTTTPSR
jgi:plasmid stabilization system protein ParE